VQNQKIETELFNRRVREEALRLNATAKEP